MKAATVLQAADQVKDGLNELSGIVKEFSGNVSDRWNDTRHDLERRAKKIRIATEDQMEAARYRIKAHPLAVAAAIASGAFLLGVVTGWAASRSRH